MARRSRRAASGQGGDRRRAGEAEHLRGEATPHGARYYAPWLGRWTSADPTGISDGLNLYRYSRDNPIRFSDPGGTQSIDQDWQDLLATRRVAQGALVDRAGGSPQFEGEYGIGASNPIVIKEGHIKAHRRRATPRRRKPRPRHAVVPKTTGAPSVKPAPAPTPLPSHPGHPATAGEAIGAFAKGAAEGAAIGLGFIALGAVSSVAAAVVGVALLGYGVYKLATGGYKAVEAGAKRLATGKGTAADYQAVGGIVGGIAVGGVGGLGEGEAAGEGAIGGTEGGTTAGEESVASAGRSVGDAEGSAGGGGGRFIANRAGDVLDTSRITIPDGKFGYLLENPSKAGIFRRSLGFDRESLGPALREHLLDNFDTASPPEPMVGGGTKIRVTGLTRGPSGKTWTITTVWGIDPNGTVRLITASP